MDAVRGVNAGPVSGGAAGRADRGNTALDCHCETRSNAAIPVAIVRG